MDDAVFLLALLALSSRGRAAPGKRRGGSPAHKGTERTATRTPQTPDAARSQIVASFRALEGRDPSPNELGMLLAHSAGETGRWGKMTAWNYGFTTTLGGHDWFQLPGNPLRFRWYPDAASGCGDWLAMLKDGFPGAWEALPAGDPVRYVQGLLNGRAGSYFGTGPVAAYERLVGRLYVEFLPMAEGKRAPNRRARGQADWLLPLRDAKP